MTQIKNKNRSFLKKKDYSVRHFTSVLTTAREILKKGKNPDKMCQLLFLKIYPQ